MGARPYFVMEYVIGDPITRFADAHRLSIPDRLTLFTQVCEAVQHAHTKGIIHRDLKPTNVLVSMVDGRPFAKVIDFGIAKSLASRLTEKTLFTEHRQLIGTPEYMSPEQAEGSPDIDTRTDVYALGVLLYELLVGATPLDAARLRSAAFAEMQRIIKEEDPPAPSLRLTRSLDTLAATAAVRQSEPSKLSTQIKGELDWIVMKALDKDRARRYESPNQLAADVRMHLSGEPVVAAPPSTRYRLRKLVRRHKLSVLTGSTVLAALMLGVAGVCWEWRRSVEANAAFRTERVELVDSLVRTLASSGMYPKVRLDSDGVIRDDSGTVIPLAQFPGDDWRSGPLAFKVPIMIEEKMQIVVDDLQHRKSDLEAANTSLTRQREEAEWAAYTANIALAQAAIAMNDFPQAASRNALAPMSKRGWEWRFINATIESTKMWIPKHVGEYWSPDGRFAELYQTGATRRILDANSDQESRLVGMANEELGDDMSAWAADSRTLYVQHSGTTGSIWHAAESGEWTRTATLSETGRPWRVAFLGSTKWLLTSDQGGHVTIWDSLRKGTVEPSSVSSVDDITSSVDFVGSEAPIIAAAGKFCNEVKVWGVSEKGQLALVATLKHDEPARAVAISNDGNVVITGTEHDSVLAWQRHEDGRYSVHGRLENVRGVWSLRINAVGTWVAGSSTDGACSVWDLSSQGSVQPICLVPVSEQVQSSNCAFTPDGTRLVAGLSGGLVTVWDLATHQLLDRWSADPNAEPWSETWPVIASDGDRLFVQTGHDGAVTTWMGSLSRGRGIETVIPRGFDEDMRPRAIRANDAPLSVSGLGVATPDGTRRITLSDARTLRFVDIPTGKEVASFPMSLPVSALQMDADGKRLIISLADGTSRLWDLRGPAERQKDLQREWNTNGAK